MADPKRLVVLTDYNWHDYLGMEYLESLVRGLEIGEGGVDQESKVVTRLLAWVAMQSGQSAEFRFEMSRHDAAAVLNLAAGRDAALLP